MPKFKYPPQGGEKHLCLTLFCTMMLSIISAVGIIYSIVIIYIPAMTELESNLTGPKMCTTLAKEGNLTTPNCGVNGTDEQAWSSCEEWCLSMSSKECSHVYASVRDLGTEIDWAGCDLNDVDSTDNIVDQTLFKTSAAAAKKGFFNSEIECEKKNSSSHDNNFFTSSCMTSAANVVSPEFFVAAVPLF